MQKIQEARQAARRTLTLLDEAKQQLSSARNWGIYDLLGGKFFTSLIKHDKIDKAERLLRQAQESLHLLQKKVGDVDFSLQPALQISDLERFMDIALDNIISDWMVQSKIQSRLQDLERIAVQVRRLSDRLEHLEREVM